MISFVPSDSGVWTKPMDKSGCESFRVVRTNIVNGTNCCSNLGVSGTPIEVGENSSLEEVATRSVNEISSNKWPPVVEELSEIRQCVIEPNDSEDNGRLGNDAIEHNCSVGSVSVDNKDSGDGSDLTAVAKEYRVSVVLADGNGMSVSRSDAQVGNCVASVDEHGVPQDTRKVRTHSNHWIPMANIILENHAHCLKVIVETDSERNELFHKVGCSEPNSSGQSDHLGNTHPLSENNCSDASMYFADQKSSVDCGEMLAENEVNEICLVLADDINVSETCLTLSNICEPCQGQTGQLHENVSYNDAPGAPKVSNADRQVSTIRKHVEKELACLEIIKETYPRSSEPFHEVGSYERNAGLNDHVGDGKSMLENNHNYSSTCMKAAVSFDNKCSVHCSEMLNKEKENRVSMVLHLDNNVDETWPIMGTICNPCSGKTELLHENVSYEGIQMEKIGASVEQGVLNAFCRVPAEQSGIQVSTVDNHMGNLTHCLITIQETDGDKNEPGSVSSEVSACSKGKMTVKATSQCNGPLIKEKERSNVIAVSKSDLPHFEVCTSGIIEECHANEAEVLDVNASNNTVLLVEKGIIVDKEGAENAGQLMETESACNVSAVISTDCHVENQISIPDIAKNQSTVKSEYLTKDLYCDASHCRENSFVPEDTASIPVSENSDVLGSSFISGSISIPDIAKNQSTVKSEYLTKDLCCDASHCRENSFVPEDRASIPVSENSDVLGSSFISGFVEGQVKSEHQCGKVSANTNHCGEDGRIAAFEEVGHLLTDHKGNPAELAPSEGSRDKAFCSSTMTQEASSTKLSEETVLYDVNYCREGGILGQIEEAVDSNKLPYEQKKISILSVDYSPETASSNHTELTGSPSSRLSMSQQIETKGAITSTCCSSVATSLVPLTCDDDSSVQDNKSFDSKSSTSKTVQARKSVRLSRRKNVARQCRKTGTSALLSHVTHVLSLKIARRKRNRHHKQRRLSCWGAMESLMQLFTHDDRSLCSGSLNDHIELRVQGNESRTAKGKGADNKVSKRSKRSTSSNKKRTNTKKAVKGRWRKQKASLSNARKQCLEAGSDSYKNDPLKNVIISDLPTDAELPERVIDAKAADGGSDSTIHHLDVFMNHVQHQGEDTGGFVAKTSSGNSCRVCQGGSSETCMGSLHEELKTKDSATSLCTDETDPLHTKGLSKSHSPAVESHAINEGSEIKFAGMGVSSVSTICRVTQSEYLSSKESGKVGLTMDDSSIYGNEALDSSKACIAAGTVLPLRTYSKKRKSPAKATGRQHNSGDTSKAGNSLTSRPRQKASNNQSKRQYKIAGKQKSQGNNSVARRKVSKNCQAEASTGAEMPLNASYANEKAGEEPVGIGKWKDSPASSGAPEKTTLFKECVTEVLQTPQEHEPKKNLQKKKESVRRTCRSNCAASGTRRKGRKGEKVKKALQKFNKSESSEPRENGCNEKASRKSVIMEPGSKILLSEVERNDSPQRHNNDFQVKAPLSDRHHRPGVDVTANDTLRFATLMDNLHSDNSIYEVVGSSAPRRLAWVSCDDCHKWRSIPAELADSIGDTDCRWTCKDNIDKRFADCSIPQEKSNAEINAELNISEGSCDEEFSGPQRFSNSHQSVQVSVPQQDTWKRVQHNVFLHRNRKTQTIDEVMVCHCKPPRDGSMGCGDECLNRMLNIECVQGTCPCGELCSNQQFQKQKYAKFMWFRCGKKGYGLQLEENVSQGQFLIEYVGEVLDSQIYEARQREYAARGQRHFYFMTLNNSEVIDACFKGNLGRFINHSCDPNCRTEKWMVNGEVCVGLFALRDIKMGEEVTFDYNYVRVFGAAAKKCFCGSSNCRGYIGGDPSNTEAVIESDSEENFPEPVMVMEDDEKKHPEVDLVVKNTLPITVLPSDTTPDTTNPMDDLAVPSNGATSIEVNEVKNNIPAQVTSSRAADLKDVVHIPTKEDSLGTADAKKRSPESNIKNPKHSSVLVKSSRTMKKSKHGNHQGKAAKPRKVLIAADRNRFEGVEEKLNELLDMEGGINRRKDAAKGYLKLLFITASSGDNVNGGSHQSIRDLSIILDAILKTKSRTVLVDIINKNGLQMLHNIMKQNRKNFNKTPIIRKLLKVVEFLAGKEILTLEHIIAAPPCTGMESFRESIMALMWHNDVQVQQMARSFRDKYVPQTIRKLRCPDREDGISHWNRHAHKHWQSQVSRWTDAINCTSSHASEFISDSHKRCHSSPVMGQAGVTENNKHWEDNLSHRKDTVNSTTQQIERPLTFHRPIKMHPVTAESGSRCCDDAAVSNGYKSLCTEQDQLGTAVDVEPNQRKRKSRWEPLDETRAQLYYVKQKKVHVVEKHSNDQASSVIAEVEGLEQSCVTQHAQTDGGSLQVQELDPANSEASKSCGNQVPDARPPDETQRCQSSSGASSSEVAASSGQVPLQASPSCCNSQVSEIQQERLQHTQRPGSGWPNWPAPNNLFPAPPPLPPNLSRSLPQAMNDSVPPGFEGMRQPSHLASVVQVRPSEVSDTRQTLPPGGCTNRGESGMGRRPFIPRRWNSRYHQKVGPPWVHHRGFKGHPKNEPKDGLGFHGVHMRPPMGGGNSSDMNSSNAMDRSLGSVHSHHQPLYPEAYHHQPTQQQEVYRSPHQLEVHQQYQQQHQQPAANQCLSPPQNHHHQPHQQEVHQYQQQQQYACHQQPHHYHHQQQLQQH